MTFDSVFFILVGAYTTTVGILNKDVIPWRSYRYKSEEFEQKYKRAINIVMGILCIFIGLALIK